MLLNDTLLQDAHISIIQPVEISGQFHITSISTPLPADLSRSNVELQTSSNTRDASELNILMYISQVFNNHAMCSTGKLIF